ncbi:UNVERIFIED_CONTAM: Glutathione S-transferase protein [Siphonaria sp. JEL0065]|nr:Glutathione S-transferase protein [Siphonaria sp. JEL0065]
MTSTKPLKLLHFPASPFVRKVIIVAKEVGVYDKVEIVPVTVQPFATTGIEKITSFNPLTKIPALDVPGLGPLYGSSVIVQYLLSIGQKEASNRILPSLESPTRFPILTREALADGASEALLLMRFEKFLRPQEKYWAEFYNGQFGKVNRALDEMERIQSKKKESLDNGTWNLGDVATLCTLSYADLRFGGVFDWRLGRLALKEWFEKEHESRDSVKTTRLK